MSLRLDHPNLYADEVRKLASRHERERWRLPYDLSAPLMLHHADALGARLAKEVPRGAYAFQPLIPRHALINGKERTIYKLDALDAVVWGALTRVLLGVLEPKLGEHLFSYRKGMSQWTACRAFLRYLHGHRAARPDPKTRGLFVLRRDVRRYDESIPTDDDSPLWRTLSELYGTDMLGLQGDLTAFVKAAFRPPIQQADGTVRPLQKGVATGLPTQTIACNAYLLPLDRELLAIEGGVYLRFGDDLLFAHPELAQAERAHRLLDECATRLSLTFKERDTRAYWLTVPGSAHPSASNYRPASRLSYLGFDVGFDGARLRADKRRALWLSLRARFDHTYRLLGPASAAERAQALCSVARTMFDVRSPLADRYAPWLHFDVMSRQDLRQLDHLIALHIAEKATGRRGVRAFRDCPPETLYREHGLPSLLRTWDEKRKRRGSPE
jgi:hypothetical protein